MAEWPIADLLHRLFHGVNGFSVCDQQYQSLKLGFVDAAVMAVAEQLRISRVATIDRRDFGAVTLEIQLDLLP